MPHTHTGLAALGTEDEEVFEDVKNVLYTDSAVGAFSDTKFIGHENVKCCQLQCQRGCEECAVH
jgi:hypothetical protein